MLHQIRMLWINTTKKYSPEHAFCRGCNQEIASFVHGVQKNTQTNKKNLFRHIYNIFLLNPKLSNCSFKKAQTNTGSTDGSRLKYNYEFV